MGSMFKILPNMKKLHFFNVGLLCSVWWKEYVINKFRPIMHCLGYPGWMFSGSIDNVFIISLIVVGFEYQSIP